MNRLKEFESALAGIQLLRTQYGWSTPLRSIEEQLQFLVELERGADLDRRKLTRINVGVLAAREVEDMDLDLANRLYAISAEVERMAREPHA